ncbi:MAG: 30S ribosomal protein S3 [Candidatus Portnoybacteria bacterium CG10_big_fil_rev_8_21_14_0_10_44_7]|uniref:Small ribosomal subunit protein uS3 n=1 Tax=Candidatus Portnoybacteria bacterium CG10_big_fil_rev_8_21_14_0_10_44_7 TaxID=1974816 RepID=A0A2M8KIU2_9BACT|nr:MAG: 30S ribosomal protein S3 [Candidatus Portnoybacteria bacterium CG10_big_fil_rev_8_21_14_0_10_44_7]
MGRKVHPFIFRIGQTTNWKSRWFLQKNYALFLEQDVRMRDFLEKKLKRAGLDRVEIERSAGKIDVHVFSARPGLIIGRGGSGVEELRKTLQKIVDKKSTAQKQTVKLNIEEVRDVNAKAMVVAGQIVEQIEKRMPFRRVLKQTLEKVAQSKGVLGVKIAVAGRLNGAEIARREWLSKGKIPLQTLRANIDYATATAFTTYGTIGVKVWIYKGEVFEPVSKPAEPEMPPKRK